MIKRKVQRELVFQMLKRSHQKNVVSSLMILNRINPQSNLRQSRKNKLSKIVILNHNLLLRMNRNRLKNKYLSIILTMLELVLISRRNRKLIRLIRCKILMKRRRRS